MNEAALDATTLMDRIYRHQRHIYDLTRKFYLLGRDGLIRDLAPSSGATILEIGCGTGRNLIKIARTYPDALCYGLEVSPAMLATARTAVDRAGLTGRIVLAQADATSFDPAPLFGRQQFDRVVISYALSMIPPWQGVLRHAAGLIAVGGSLQVVDFGDQRGLPLAFKRLLNGWLAIFHVTPRLDLPREIDTIAMPPFFKSTCRPLYRGYAIAARVDRVG